MPGMSASVSNSIVVMENPSPTFSSLTLATVWMRVGVDARRRDARARKLRGQRHREAPGVSRADQLFRVGGRLAFLKSGLKRIRAVKRAAAHFQPPAAFGQIAFPFCFCFPCWHKVFSRECVNSFLSVEDNHKLSNLHPSLKADSYPSRTDCRRTAPTLYGSRDDNAANGESSASKW